MKIIILSPIILLVAIINSCAAQPLRLNSTEFENKIGTEQTILIDIRTPQEFSGGHLKNALNVNFYSPSFMEEISTLGKNKNVLIYCASGNRSGQALQKLKSNSFKSLADLEGGISAWAAAGKNIVK
jgi:rhodanese-related sulfurtransferase